MRRVLLLGAILLGLCGTAQAAVPVTVIVTVTYPGQHQHHRRYWWPAMDNCVWTTGTDRHGVWHAAPFVQCTAAPAHYASSPPPQYAGLPPQDNGVTVSPDAMCGPVYCATGKPDF